MSEADPTRHRDPVPCESCNDSLPCCQHFHDCERRVAERRQRYLARLAETDPLTGLFNRRYWRRCLRSGRWRDDRRRGVAVLMLDIDHFKEVNDRYGHAAGDRVLQAVAAALRSGACPGAVALRWGGEELLVIKPCSTLLDARRWADELRLRLAHLRVATRHGPVSVTVSMGLCHTAGRNLNDAALAAADDALYLAKNGGRNRLCTTDMLAATRRAA